MVTLRPVVGTVDVDAIRESVRTRLPQDPRDIHIVDELPQTPTGKIPRRKVRDDLLALDL
jgi:acyl-CoA synthetase (AMP-forming)/AMP-acid ligase II